MYVRCLVVDFSKAFDVVDHTILLTKLARHALPAHASNWIIYFLTNRNQLVKCNGVFPSVQTGCMPQVCHHHHHRDAKRLAGASSRCDRSPERSVLR